MELVKLLPVHRYSVDIFFHILFLQEYWFLTESRILIKSVLGGMRIVALSISSQHFPLVLMNRLDKTESAFFLYCRFSLSEGSVF